MKTEANTTEAPHPGQFYQHVPVENIAVGKTNPRKTFTGIEELAANIKDVGILQALLLRTVGDKTKTLELVAGERRLRAAIMAGLKTVPANVRELTDKQVREIQLIENLQREDLSPLEEAESIDQLVRSGLHTIESIAERIGRKKSTVHARRRLVSLGPKAREALQAGKLDASRAGIIASLPTNLQAEALKAALDEDWDYNDRQPSFRELQEYVEANLMRQLKDASWDAKQEGLANCVSCLKCPKRSGNMEEAGIKNANICTDLGCFEKKKAAQTSRTLEKARKAGQQVLSPEEWQEERDQFVGLNDHNYADGKNRTYKECLSAALKQGKATKMKPNPAGPGLVKGDPLTAADRTVVVVDCDGKVHQLVRKSELKAYGVKLNYQAVSDPGTARYLKQQAEARKKTILQNKVSNALNAECVRKCEASEPQNQFWFLLAVAAYESCWHESIVEIAKRRYPEAKNGTEANKQLEKSLKDFTAPQARGLVLEILALRGMRGHWGMDKHAKTALDLYKVDKAKIAAVVKEEEKARKGKKRDKVSDKVKGGKKK